MNSPAAILGLDSIGEEILTKIELTDERISLISGPPGSGQELLVSEITDKVRSSGKGLLKIDPGRFDVEVPFGAFDRLENPLLSREDVGSVGLELLNDTIDFVADGPIPFRRSLVRLLKVFGSYANTRGLSLSKEELERLERTSRLLGNSCEIILAENYSKWDRQSQRLLKLVLDPRIATVYKNFSKVNIVVVEADADQYIGKHAVKELGNLSGAWALRRIPQSAFPELLKSFGLKENLPNDVVEFLYRASNGDLDVIRQISYSGQRELDFGSLTSDEKLFEKLADSLMRQITSASKIHAELPKFIGALANSKSSLDLLTIACTLNDGALLNRLSKDKYEEISCICSDLKLVVMKSGRFRIRDDFLKNFILRLDEFRFENIHSKTSRCIAKIRPGAYGERITHLLAAGRKNEAAILDMMQQIGLHRRGMPTDFKASAYGDLQGDALNSLPLFYLILRSNELEKQRRFEEAIELLQFYAEPASDLIRAESDLALARILSQTRTKSNYARAIALLEPWAIGGLVELELWFRIMELMITLHILMHQTDLARRFYDKILKEIDKRKEFDPDALRVHFRLLRKTVSLFSGESAADRLASAVAFFRGNAGNIERSAKNADPFELFVAANNLAGILIVLGKYNDAQKFVDVASAEYEKTQLMLSKPRPEIFLNNSILCRFRIGDITAAEACQLMDECLKTLPTSSDNHLLKSSLACYSALSGDLETALAISGDSWEQITSSGGYSSYTTMIVGSNHSALLHLSGQKKEAVNLHSSLEATVNEISFKGYEAAKRRYELVAGAFSDVEEGDTVGWESYLLQTHGQQIGLDWNFYGHGFLLSDLQYWLED